MYTASCLCGEIQLEIHQNIDKIYVCHCRSCQKAQGAAFAAVAVIDKDQLQIRQGQVALKQFESSAGKHRVFCSQCGSPLWSQRDDLPALLRLRVGIINEVLNIPIYSHAYLAEKANWYMLAESSAYRCDGKYMEPES